jgi:hypothetical protein
MLTREFTIKLGLLGLFMRGPLRESVIRSASNEVEIHIHRYAYRTVIKLTAESRDVLDDTENWLREAEVSYRIISHRVHPR